MADEQIRIDVTAEDNASRTIDEVADEAERLERLEPQVTVEADTADAKRELADVADDAERLARADAEIVLRARIDDAKAALKAIRDDLEQTGEKAGDTERRLDRVGGSSGPNVRGQAIADLTGPLGEASSAASDFAGVFDGIGDIAEAAAAKVGIQSAAMSTAIGGIGVAVAGAAALWSYFSERQRKAREEQAKLLEGQRKLNELLREQNYAEAAEELTEQYRSAFDAAEKLGVNVSDLTRYLTGQTDAIPTLGGRLEDLQRMYDNATTQKTRNELLLLITQYDDLTGTIDDARGKYDDANGSIEEQDHKLRAVALSLRDAKVRTDDQTSAQDRLARSADAVRDKFDRLRGAVSFDQELLNLQGAFQRALDTAGQSADDARADVLDLKQSIIDAAETAGATPVEVRATLDKIDRGDLEGARADAQSWFDRNRAAMTVEAKPPSTWELLAIKSFIGATIGTVQVPVVGVPRSGQAYG